MEIVEAKRRKLAHVDGKKGGHEDDSSYFRSYSDVGIHEDMIADTVRTNSYRLAILRNYEKFRGKVVIDVGCGTGILSMFCVHAGAKKVYAIEASQIAFEARKVIAANKMTDRIEVIHGKVEDIEISEKVDVIVSEWMGYFLLYETMLPSVLLARDRWLKEGGYMFPDTATLYLTPFSDTKEHNSRHAFWEEEVMAKYKVDMSAMVPFSDSCFTHRLHVETVHPEDILAHAQTICHLDLLKVTPSDLRTINSNFNFLCFGKGQAHGFVTWFKVTFPMDVTLSTSPYGPETHWMQTLIYFDEPVDVEQDTEIKGSISLSQNSSNKRFLDITLEYCIDGLKSYNKNMLMNDLIT